MKEIACYSFLGIKWVLIKHYCVTKEETPMLDFIIETLK